MSKIISYFGLCLANGTEKKKIPYFLAFVAKIDPYAFYSRNLAISCEKMMRF